ncbi:O-acetyltransferase OatA [Aphelenchoides fujianensis]|nr:O-acetyltransferase OatA [Aphelenchoides fujianensis]
MITAHTKDDDDAVSFLPTTAETSKKMVASGGKSHHRITDIQGLRAVAIGAVLLFHLWPQRFPLGFLGVDMFFVISGYLMCMLLSRKSSLSLEDAGDFYYRRIKRIVPTYVFVVGATLAGCLLLISRFEYKQLVDEAVPSLFFYSNFPSVHSAGYFDFRTKFRFFLHTWSLSTEIQFYGVVPALMLVLGRLRRLHPACGHLFLLLISAASFYRQTHPASELSAHMSLDGRVWEFMAGFFGHFAHDSKLLDFKGQLRSVFSFLFNYGLVCFLLVSLVVELPTGHLNQRLVVVFLTALLISNPSGKSPILSLRSLVSLGNDSYSVYLVHWPLFMAFRYWQSAGRSVDAEISWRNGLLLIGLSIFLGFLVEKFFERILLLISSWSSLLVVLFVSYAAVGSLMLHMERNAMTLVEEQPLGKLAEERRFQTTLELWQTRENQTAFPPARLLQLNKEIAYLALTCRNTTRWLPAVYDNSSLVWVGYICNERGSGTKNVLVIGNSHASIPFFAIANAFRPLAARITLMATGSCTPLYEWSGMKPHTRIEACKRVLQTFVKLLKAWTEPIDIAIVNYAYVDFWKEQDLPLAANPKDDRMLGDLQAFYSTISNITREAVLIGGVHLLWEDNPLQTLQKALLAKEKIGAIGETRQKQAAHLPNIQRRFQLLDCPRCRLIDWQTEWCSAEWCDAVDPRRNLAYFLDEHHTTSYGSMFVADRLLREYKNMTKTIR